MNSLNDLNNYGSTSLEYTDVRLPSIGFDRLDPTNQSIIYNQGDAYQLPIGINITKLTQPDLEIVYLKITLNVTGATVTFPTLPSRYTVDNSSTGVWMISFIQSVEDWELIKNIFVKVPNSYKQNYSYTVSIEYEGNKSKTYTVNAAYSPLVQVSANLQTSFSQTLYGGFTLRTIVPLSAQLRFNANAVQTAVLLSKVNLGCVAKKNKGLYALINSVSTLTAIGNQTIDNVIDRSFYSNTTNDIFATNTPKINYNPGGSPTYVVTLTSPAGTFGDATSYATTYTITGTLAQVNAALAGVKFYSTLNYSSNSTYTFKLTVGGTVIRTVTKSLNYLGTATIVPTTTYYYGSTTWTPTGAQKKYYQMDYTVVGGGGGGGGNNLIYAGSGQGGGGGSVINATAILLSNIGSFTITVGLGGTPSGTTGSTTGKSGSSSSLVSNGGTVSINAVAAAGIGGVGISGYTGSASSGGNGAGGSGFAGSISTNLYKGGNGGNGLAGLDGVVYGYGGGGGVSWDGNTSGYGYAGKSYSTYGSGGTGGGGTNTGNGYPTSGRNGLVIIKIY